MKKIYLLLLLLLMPLFYACSSDDDPYEDEIFTLYITYHGTEYTVPCKFGKHGKIIYLNEEFKALYDNVLSKNENLVTYVTGEYSITYYDSVEEMTKDLHLKII